MSNEHSPLTWASCTMMPNISQVLNPSPFTPLSAHRVTQANSSPAYPARPLNDFWHFPKSNPKLKKYYVARKIKKKKHLK